MKNDLPRGPLPAWTLVILGSAFALFTSSDWYRLANGMGENHLWLAAKCAKLLFTAVCFATLLAARSRSSDRADWIRLTVAFSLVLLGDLGFFLGMAMPAVAVFTLAQVALVFRNSAGLAPFARSGGLGRAKGLAAGAAIGVLTLDGVIIAVAFREFLLGSGPLTAVVGVVYACFLSLSVWVAWMTLATGRFAAREARMIAAAMTLFYFCDVTVGLGGVYEGELVGQVARNLTWAFYGPAVVLLLRSGMAERRKR